MAMNALLAIIADQQELKGDKVHNSEHRNPEKVEASSDIVLSTKSVDLKSTQTT